jgi:hypothetical protein
MAATFVQSQSQALTFLNQADKQLDTADRLIGTLGAAVATQQIARAENLYGQANTYLGLATTSNSNAQTQINDMATQSVVTPEVEATRSLSARSQDITRGIDAARASSDALLRTLDTVRYNQRFNAVVPAPSSSGEEVIQAQQARDENALVENPPEPLQTFNDAGELVTVNDQVSSDTNAIEPRLLNTEDLGVVDGISTVGGGRVTRSLVATQGFTRSPSDDNTQTATADTNGGGIADGQRPAIAPEFLSRIIPTENKLSKLASMNYAISIYIMNDDEFKRMLATQKKVLPTQQLIMQSGGIDKGLGFGVGQRNKYFDVDFYIENLEIVSTVGTQGGARAHNALTMTFNVMEPNGITFVNRLRYAVKEHLARTSQTTVSEAVANYLMVIRFYGYDAQGNLVNGSELGINEVGSDTNSVVEKFFPFQINNIDYKITNRTTDYRVTCTVSHTNVAYNQIMATIPFDFELNAPDVQTLLNGRAVLGQTANSATGVNAQGIGVGIPVYAEDGSASNLRQNPETGELYDPGGSEGFAAPPKASSLSNTKLYTQGLCEALNQFQLELQQKEGYEIADQFEIILENVSGLKDAKISRPGKQDKGRATMPIATTAAEALLPGRTRYDNESKNWSVTRGTQIVQLIDLVMRNSSYITSQQNVVFDEGTGKPISQTPVSTVQWFKIRSRVSPLGYDKKRRAIAYKTTYTVSRYQINTPLVPTFPNARYRGTHKLYNYWFTGLNSEVLDFDINVNYQYVTTFGSGQGNQLEIPNQLSSGRLYERFYFQNKPNAEGTGGTGNTTSPAAQLSERLYSDGDVEKSILTIIGDPDWLQQTEAFYNLTVDLKPFMPDGSVNTDASEVLYEVRFNPVTDYNITTGLAEVNANNTAYSQATGENNLASQSIVYAAQTVTSNFRNGRFTQRIAGTLRPLIDPVDITAGLRGNSVGTNGSRDFDTTDQIAVDTNSAARNATGTVEAPPYTDPQSGNPTEGFAQASTPVAKPGSTVVSDDAAEQISPFQVGA